MSSERPNKRKSGDQEATHAAATSLASTSSELGFFSSKRLKSADITSIVIECFRQNKYDQLERELMELSTSHVARAKIDKFLLKEGDMILFSALKASSELPLKFLAEKNTIFPKQTLQTILEKDNFRCLQAFLYAQTGLEGAGLYTDTLGKMQVEKFKILLSIDSEAVRSFMRDNSNNQHLQTKIVRDNFDTAQREFAEENASAAIQLIPS